MYYLNFSKRHPADLPAAEPHCACAPGESHSGEAAEPRLMLDRTCPRSVPGRYPMVRASEPSSLSFHRIFSSAHIFRQRPLGSPLFRSSWPEKNYKKKKNENDNRSQSTGAFAGDKLTRRKKSLPLREPFSFRMKSSENKK